MWLHWERILGGLYLVSSSLCPMYLFPCWFCFVSYNKSQKWVGHDYRLSTWWILWAHLSYGITRHDGGLGDCCHTISTSLKWCNTVGLDLSPTSNKYKTRNNGFRHCTIGSGNSDIWRKGNKHGKRHNCPSFLSGKFLDPNSRKRKQNPVVSWDENPGSQYSQNSWVREPEGGQPEQSMVWIYGKSCHYSLAENLYAHVWEETLKPSELLVTLNESSQNDFQNSHKALRIVHIPNNLNMNSPSGRILRILPHTNLMGIILDQQGCSGPA